MCEFPKLIEKNRFNCAYFAWDGQDCDVTCQQNEVKACDGTCQPTSQVCNLNDSFYSILSMRLNILIIYYRQTFRKYLKYHLDM